MAELTVALYANVAARQDVVSSLVVFLFVPSIPATQRFFARSGTGKGETHNFYTVDRLSVTCMDDSIYSAA
jgi:hypothetical protein